MVRQRNEKRKHRPMQRDIERVQELYEAHAKRNLKSILLFLDNNLEFTMSPELPWGGTYVGKEGMRRALAAVAEHLETRIEIERLIDAGAQVVAVGRTIGRAKATQLEFDVPLVHVWSLRDGQVVKLDSYVDNATLLSVLEG